MFLQKSRFKSNLVYRAYFNFRDYLLRRKYRSESLRFRKAFIESVLPKNGVGAELGVFKGEFSKILWEFAVPKKLHLVDPWYKLAPEWNWADGDKSTVNALIRIIKYFRLQIEAGRVFIHIDSDLEVLKKLPDGYFDWVYIDSSHDYEHTINELKILRLKMKPEGIISGDDWRPDQSHRHHGVYRAVNEFVLEENYEIIYSNSENLQWAIRRSNE